MASREQKEALAGRLRELRQELGWTQEQLARRAGVPVSSLRNWESAHRSPDLWAALTLAGAMGVGLEELLEPPASQERPGVGRPRKPLPTTTPDDG